MQKNLLAVESRFLPGWARWLQRPAGESGTCRPVAWLDEGSGKMTETRSWDWDIGSRKVCDLTELAQKFTDVHEFAVSPDGERIAAPVLTAPDVFAVWVNGELWNGEYEKAWHLRFTPDGRLWALVRIDDEWTLAADGEPWEQRWEFAWNPVFSNDGTSVAVCSLTTN